MAQIVSSWDELQKVLAQMEPPCSHSSPTMTKGQRTKWKCVQNHIKKAFARLWDETHWNQTSLPPVKSPLWAQAPETSGFLGKYTSTWSGSGGRWKMKPLPKLGLGTIYIYIALLCKGLILLKHMSEVFRYRDGKVLSTQPHPTRRLAFTYCVQNPNLIKRSSNS